MQTFSSHSVRQFLDDITMRSHIGGCPVAELAAVHRKAIMMFRNRHHVLRASHSEQLGPGRRIETLGLEHGNEVFVTKRI